MLRDSIKIFGVSRVVVPISMSELAEKYPSCEFDCG